MPKLLERHPIETPPSWLDDSESMNGLLRDGRDPEQERRGFIRRQNERRRAREERAGHQTYTGFVREAEAERRRG